jgi:hypothetical protein
MMPKKKEWRRKHLPTPIGRRKLEAVSAVAGVMAEEARGELPLWRDRSAASVLGYLREIDAYGTPFID